MPDWKLIALYLFSSNLTISEYYLRLSAEAKAKGLYQLSDDYFACSNDVLALGKVSIAAAMWIWIAALSTLITVLFTC